jgi:hypothetical protein
MRNGNSVDKKTFDSTYGALFFGVPNQGMDIESLIPMAKERPNLPFLISLGLSSSSLRNLHREFCKAFEFKDSEIVSFYETEESQTARRVSIHFLPSSGWITATEASC